MELISLDTLCYLPPNTSESPGLTPAIKANTRFNYPGGMKS